MKLISHSEKRKGDTVTIHGTWTARNRQSAAVWLGLLKGTDGRAVDAAEADKPLIQGDVWEVNGIMNGIAQIAWARGWRPMGLEATLVNMLRNFGKPGMPKATTPGAEVDRTAH
jgi:hypothetical protein